MANNLSRRIYQTIHSSRHHQIHRLLGSNSKIHSQLEIHISLLFNLTILASKPKIHSLKNLKKRRAKLIRKVDLSSKSSSISKQPQPMIMMVLKGYPTLIRKAISLKQVVIMRVNKDLRVERGLQQSSISYLTGTKKLAVILTLTSITCRITRIAALIQREK